jgi:hypothetical protein
MMSKENAIKLAAEKNVCGHNGFEAKVVQMFRGKKALDFNVQFRKIGDTSTLVDGKFSFVVVD